MIQLNSQRTSRLQEILGQALRCLPIYLALEIIGRLIEATFEPAAARFGNPSGGSEDSMLLLAIFVAVSTVWALVSGALRLLAARETLTLPRSPLSRMRRMNLLIIESTRAMASVMFRIPLLVLPALLQWVRLAPLPYLILLSPDYEGGKIDALKLSSQFASQRRLLTLFIATLPIITLIPEYFFATEASAHSTLLTDPLQHIGSIVGMSAIKFAFDVFVLKLVSRKLTPPQDTCRIES